MEIDNKTLTFFLMECMTQTFEHSAKAQSKEAQSKPLVPGTVQRGFKNGPLTYLEIISGTIKTSRAEILVYNEGGHGPIFGMNIVSKLETETIQENSLVYTDVLDVLQKARLNGFKLTREKIQADQTFSLFEIPPHSEPAPVGKYGRPGSLNYKETIDDTLDFFGGGEEIYIQSDGFSKRRSLVFRSQIQGCRLI